MLFHLKQIDFTKEPYKSMIEPDDPAIYKEYVKLFCTYIAEPDEDVNGVLMQSKFMTYLCLTGFVS